MKVYFVKGVDNMRRLTFPVAVAALIQTCPAEIVKSVDMLTNENWWGLNNNFGREMPFTSRTKLEFDLRKDNYAHQAQSVLVSDRGRAIWCPEPVGVAFANGRIRLVSDSADITLVDAELNPVKTIVGGRIMWRK